jgi:hypothetical protein
VPNDLSRPLQDLIRRAAGTLPAATGEAARYRARLDGAGSAIVLLADVSSSMAEPAGKRTKAAILHEALANVWPGVPGAVLIAFGSTAGAIGSPAELPSPAGGTALHLALEAATGHRPRRTVVISDGRPDCEERALDAAGRLPGTIDVIYCGPDSDAQAIGFMQRLARLGGGRVVVRDVVRMARPSLAGDVRTMLGLPAPGGR